MVPSLLFVTTKWGAWPWKAMPSGSAVAEGMGTCWTIAPALFKVVNSKTGDRADRNRKFPVGSNVIPSTKPACEGVSTAKLVEVVVEGLIEMIVHVDVNRQSAPTYTRLFVCGSTVMPSALPAGPIGLPI